MDADIEFIKKKISNKLKNELEANEHSTEVEANIENPQQPEETTEQTTQEQPTIEQKTLSDLKQGNISELKEDAKEIQTAIQKTAINHPIKTAKTGLELYATKGRNPKALADAASLLHEAGQTESKQNIQQSQSQQKIVPIRPKAELIQPPENKITQWIKGEWKKLEPYTDFYSKNHPDEFQALINYTNKANEKQSDFNIQNFSRQMQSVMRHIQQELRQNYQKPKLVTPQTTQQNINIDDDLKKEVSQSDELTNIENELQKLAKTFKYLKDNKNKIPKSKYQKFIERINNHYQNLNQKRHNIQKKAA